MVNRAMGKARRQAVQGVIAPTPRATWQAAGLLACALAVPVFVLLTLADWLVW